MKRFKWDATSIIKIEKKDVETINLSGSFVIYSPHLEISEIELLDKDSIINQLYEMGAKHVVYKPIKIIEKRKIKKIPKKVFNNPKELVIKKLLEKLNVQEMEIAHEILNKYF